MFEDTLQDLVKSLRACKTEADVNEYIARSVAKIKEELGSRDVALKAVALQKLTHVRGPALSS